MKRPWIVFSAICSLVMGIVLFCVIFGGYSSLLRSQSRITTVKQMLAEQCTAQVGLALRLLALPSEEASPEQKTALDQTARKLKSVLVRMAAAKDPLDRELVEKFEIAQKQITRGINVLVTALKQNQGLAEKDLDVILREQKELNTAVIVMVKQYNKEATYFNTRSRQFPGMFIAKLFSLDHLRFPEIAPPALIQGETASAS